MDAPVTVDDMFDYLTAVKNQYNCTYPIFIDNSAVLEGFTGAFGTAGINLGWTDLGMMMDGDTVVSSLTDEHFRNYIEGFHKFYAAGLIKDDFYSESYGPDYINSYVSNDQCAVTSIRGDKFTTMTAAAISPPLILRPWRRWWRTQATPISSACAPATPATAICPSPPAARTPKWRHSS